ncbi:MAG: hypothetical protein ACI4GD_11055 [Lachnospiraceae bacterium]
MGLSFSNIHIRKNNEFNLDKLINEITVIMESKGYYAAMHDDEDLVSVDIYNPNGSNWVTISSDCFELCNDNDTKALAKPLSHAFGTDILSVACFDSDYLFMNLVNESDGTDAWVNVGGIPGMKMPRRTAFGSWKKKVRDIEEFKKVIKEDHLFAEDALYLCENLFELAPGQSVGPLCDVEEEEKEGVVRLYFSVPEKEVKELPFLENMSHSLIPCRMGEEQIVWVVNNGGKSRGIAIIFVGDFIENDEITYENVQFLYHDTKGNQKNVPITPEKVHTQSGRYMLYWEDKDFVIPQKVNPDLPWQKAYEKKWRQSLGVSFVPKGNERKRLDITVFVAPLENYEAGSSSWYVWKGHKDKLSYIDWYNQQEESLKAHKPCNYIRPEDFDI